MDAQFRAEQWKFVWCRDVSSFHLYLLLSLHCIQLWNSHLICNIAGAHVHSVISDSELHSLTLILRAVSFVKRARRGMCSVWMKLSISSMPSELLHLYLHQWRMMPFGYHSWILAKSKCSLVCMFPICWWTNIRIIKFWDKSPDSQMKDWRQTSFTAHTWVSLWTWTWSVRYCRICTEASANCCAADSCTDLKDSFCACPCKSAQELCSALFTAQA